MAYEGKPSRRVKRLNEYESEMPGSLNAASSHVGSNDRDSCGWRLCGMGAGFGAGSGYSGTCSELVASGGDRSC